MGITRRDFVRRFLGLLALPIIRGASGALPVQPPVVRYRLDRFHIAGFKYYSGPSLVARLRPGDRLLLRAEPDNPHDPQAVEVFWGADKLGYVPRCKNPALSRLLAQGAPVEGRVRAVDPAAEPWEMVEAEALLAVPAEASAGDVLSAALAGSLNA